MSSLKWRQHKGRENTSQVEKLSPTLLQRLINDEYNKKGTEEKETKNGWRIKWRESSAVMSERLEMDRERRFLVLANFLTQFTHPTPKNCKTPVRKRAIKWGANETVQVFLLSPFPIHPDVYQILHPNQTGWAGHGWDDWAKEREIQDCFYVLVCRNDIFFWDLNPFFRCISSLIFRVELLGIPLLSFFPLSLTLFTLYTLPQLVVLRRPTLYPSPKKNHHIHTLCTILGNKKKGAIRTLRPLPWCYFGYNKNFFSQKKKTDSGQIKCLAFRSFNEEKRIELNGCDEREIHWPRSLVCVFHSHLTHAAPRRLPKGKGKKDPKALIDTNKWYNNPNFPFFLNNITRAHTSQPKRSEWKKHTSPVSSSSRSTRDPPKRFFRWFLLEYLMLCWCVAFVVVAVYFPQTLTLTLTVRWVPWLALVWFGEKKGFISQFIWFVCFYLSQKSLFILFQLSPEISVVPQRIRRRDRGV